MLVTTKRGDDGMTEYFGKRLKKDDAWIEYVGTVDELQAVVEIVGIDELANDLYQLMGRKEMTDKRKSLEDRIEGLTKSLNVKRQFVTFTSDKSRQLNWLRTVVRRAERRAIAAGVEREARIYLNRLSDYIYLLALKEEK